jgi:hypothetical protein
MQTMDSENVSWRSKKWTERCEAKGSGAVEENSASEMKGDRCTCLVCVKV